MDINEAWLRLLFHGTNIDGIADNAAFPLGDLWVGLYIKEAGFRQDNNETKYTGYKRIKVARSVSGWFVDGTNVTPATDINFPECLKESSLPITHFAVGSSASGDGLIFIKGAVNPVVELKLGVIPRLEAPRVGNHVI